MSAEAARYRVQLREAEAQRDTLTARLDTMTRARVDEIAGRVLAVPADLTDHGGVTIPDLLDEHGDVDDQAVSDAATRLAADRPGLALPAPLASAAAVGLGVGGSPPPAPTSWGSVLAAGATTQTTERGQ